MRTPDREPGGRRGWRAGAGPDTDTRLGACDECVVTGREPAWACGVLANGECAPRGDPVREMFTKRVLSWEPGRDEPPGEEADGGAGRRAGAMLHTRGIRAWPWTGLGCCGGGVCPAESGPAATVADVQGRASMVCDGQLGGSGSWAETLETLWSQFCTRSSARPGPGPPAAMVTLELPNFRAVVGEQARDRCMDETIRAILLPAGRSNPWDRARRPAQPARVQGNSKYVALRSVSTDPAIGGRATLPVLQPDMSGRGTGTPRTPPHVTLMANKMQQIQGGLAPMGSGEELQHFHRFNKSLNSMQLRRDLFKGPTVQMEYILNKKPAGAEAVNPLLGVAVDALREKPRSKWAAASSASSSSTEGSASNSAGQNTSIALLAPGVARRHRRGWLSGSVLMLHILCVLCRLGTTAHPLLSASNIWSWRVSANAIWIWRIGPFSTGLLTVS